MIDIFGIMLFIIFVLSLYIAFCAFCLRIMVRNIDSNVKYMRWVDDYARMRKQIGD